METMSLVDNPTDETTNQNAPKKVVIETWGCQMNVADSETMLEMLRSRNYEITESLDDADLVLLNTCHIREKATHKVISRLGRLREITSAKSKPTTIAVAGCVAQAEGKKLLKQAPNIDILFGPGKISELPQLLDEHKKSGQQVLSIGFANKNTSETQSSQETPESASILEPVGTKTAIHGKTEISRYVNIAQGCNNFCTFCVVPFTRGREISRSKEDILQECSSMLQQGAKEITLLGQNVNSYGLDLLGINSNDFHPDDGGPFVDLLAAVASLDGLDRLRFTTSNPHDFTRPLAQLFAAQPKLGRYIHLPVQCGNNEVLAAMKRKVTVESYLERVNWLRDVDPEFAISTDLIVGFPGETEEQFEGTLELMKAVGYSFVFAFKYSPRKGTAAARFRQQIPEEVKSQRLAKLNELQDQMTMASNQKEIGRHRQVLVHYESKKDPGHYYGRTEQFRLVKIPSGRDIIGHLVEVDIIDANKTALLGRLL